MNDTKNFQKYAEEAKKQMKVLKSENSKLRKIQILHEENKALEDLTNQILNEKMARQVAKKEPAMVRYKKKKFGDKSEKKSYKKFEKQKCTK